MSKSFQSADWTKFVFTSYKRAICRVHDSRCLDISVNGLIVDICKHVHVPVASRGH